MQQVKADATAVGVENEIGRQMVEINQICSGDDKPCGFPTFTPQDCSNQEGCNPMPAIMKQGLEEVYPSIQSRKKL